MKRALCLVALTLLGCGTPPETDGSGPEELAQQSIWTGGDGRWTRCNGYTPSFGDLVFYRSTGWTGECVRWWTVGGNGHITWNNLDQFTWRDGSNLNDNVGSWRARAQPYQTQKITVCQHAECSVCWGGHCNDANNLDYYSGPSSDPPLHGNSSLWGVSAFILQNRF